MTVEIRIDRFFDRGIAGGIPSNISVVSRVA
jgi:hypothetical protein